MNDFRHTLSLSLLMLALDSPVTRAAPPTGPNCAPSEGRVLSVAPTGATFSSIQSALNSAQPGDTVLVAPGVYKGGNFFPRSGKDGACIRLRGVPGQSVIDGKDGSNFGILIDGKAYIAVEGITIRNFRSGEVPTGIKVQGLSQHIDVVGNHVLGINRGSGGDAHGISFYGRSSTPMSDLYVDGNEIDHCVLGTSETLVFNGNVAGIRVSRNRIHDNDNIGIDFIGFEGKGPDGQEQARDAICTGNVISHITARHNPTYLVDGAQGATADGIYVDGGTGIVIEENKVSQCDIGIEVSSEHLRQAGSHVMIRNNVVSTSLWGNIHLGGESSTENGGATDITIEGNQLSLPGYVQILLQNYTNGVQFRNNTFAPANAPYQVLPAGKGGENYNTDTDAPLGPRTTGKAAHGILSGSRLKPCTEGRFSPAGFAA